MKEDKYYETLYSERNVLDFIGNLYISVRESQSVFDEAYHDNIVIQMFDDIYNIIEDVQLEKSIKIKSLKDDFNDEDNNVIGFTSNKSDEDEVELIEITVGEVTKYVDFENDKFVDVNKE